MHKTILITICILIAGCTSPEPEPIPGDPEDPPITTPAWKPSGVIESESCSMQSLVIEVTQEEAQQGLPSNYTARGFPSGPLDAPVVPIAFTMYTCVDGTYQNQSLDAYTFAFLVTPIQSIGGLGNMGYLNAMYSDADSADVLYNATGLNATIAEMSMTFTPMQMSLETSDESLSATGIAAELPSAGSAPLAMNVIQGTGTDARIFTILERGSPNPPGTAIVEGDNAVTELVGQDPGPVILQTSTLSALSIGHLS